MRLLHTTDGAIDVATLARAAGDDLAGQPPGARVLLRLPSGPRLATLLLACLERGLVAVPVDPAIDPARADFIADHSGASVVIDQTGVTRRRAGPPAEPDDRLLVYTSGTTGDPKGVVLTGTALAANADAVAARHGFASGAHLTPLPLFHVNALCMSLIGCLRSHGTLVLAPGFDPIRDFAAAGALGVRTISLVPALVRALVEAAPPWPDSLRYVITAAAPLPSSLAARFFALYGARLVQGYGLSEATNFSCIMPPLDARAFEETYLARPPPVGPPLPGTEVRIVDGEVQVRGPSLMRGYWNNPTATAAAFDDGWLRTGDLGELRDGWVVLTGRRKELILRGGESLSPLEVEESFAQRGVALIAGAIRSAALGEDIGAVVATGQHAAYLGAAGTVPPRRRPRVALFAPALTTATGKPRRRAIFDGHAALDYEPDATDVLGRAQRDLRAHVPRAALVLTAPGDVRGDLLDAVSHHATYGVATVRAGRELIGAVYWGA